MLTAIEAPEEISNQDALVTDLTGVPETMLWPLWNRAAEQKRAKPLIKDSLSAELVKRIDYDFRGMFGRPTVFHPIRARVSDDLISAYADSCDGEPLVVSLGDGLDTQPWRVDDARIQWVSVDFPESIALRQKLMPRHPRARSIACSALDAAWCEQIPRDSAPFVMAAGLLMYFNEREVAGLLALIADYFPRATIFFDTITPYVSAKTLSGIKVTRKYTAPKMPWGITVDDVPDFLNSIPGIRAGHVMTYADPFPTRTRLYKFLARFGPVRRRLAGGLVVAHATRKTAVGYRG